MDYALLSIGAFAYATILASYNFDWYTPPKRRTPRVLVRVRWAWRRMRRSIKSLA